MKLKDFFIIDEQIIDNSIEIYKNKDIFILQYPKGNELSFSDGIILGFKDNKIIHIVLHMMVHQVYLLYQDLVIIL